MRPTLTREAHVATPGRLDAVLAELTGLPRADIQRAIAAGRVTVDGEPRAKSFRLNGGEALVIELPDDAELEPEDPPVPVRYRDDDLLVIAKPPGLVTHPTENRRSGTLVNDRMPFAVGIRRAVTPRASHDAGTPAPITRERSDSRSWTSIARSACTKMQPTHVCGMSPMNCGVFGSR